MESAHVRPGARWLITGAAGQLGRSLGALGRDRELELRACDRDGLDIADEARVSELIGELEPDVVVNCAAYTRVDDAERDEESARRANALGPEVLARACRDRCLLVHVSTEYVFDGRASEPIPEDAPPRPLSAYGRTKLEGEHAVEAAGGEHLIVRTQWVFGPGAGFVRTIGRAAAEGRDLRVVDDQIGRPTWSGGLARALLQAVELGARGHLHLACEGVASWYDLARATVEEGVARGLCPPVRIDPIPTREMPRPATRPSYAVLSLERARGLGIQLVDWRDALGAYLDAERDGRDA